jgi:hypothetical protein
MGEQRDGGLPNGLRPYAPQGRHQQVFGSGPMTPANKLSADLKTQHPDRPNTNAPGFVKSVYAEIQ